MRVFKKRAAVFYRVQNHQPKASDLDPTRAASLLNVFKDIRLEKRVQVELITIILF